jgi:hypothetical protein
VPDAVKQLVCDITNYAIKNKRFSKSDIQHRLVYEIGIMPSVMATEEQMLELSDGEITFDEEMTSNSGVK